MYNYYFEDSEIYIPFIPSAMCMGMDDNRPLLFFSILINSMVIYPQVSMQGNLIYVKAAHATPSLSCFKGHGSHHMLRSGYDANVIRNGNISAPCLIKLDAQSLLNRCGIEEMNVASYHKELI